MEFKSTEKALSDALVCMTRAINQLAAEDIPFQRSSNPLLSPHIDAQKELLLSLGRRLGKRLLLASSTFSFKDAIGIVDPVDPKWRKAVDLLDALLENADSALDEFNGLRRTTTTVESSQPKQFSSRWTRPPKAVRIQNLEKPQLMFSDKPSNHETKPFKPLLSRKPHSTIPLDHSLQLLPNELGVPQYRHPYQEDIERYTYPPEIFQKKEPIPPQPFETTEPTVVETYDDVLSMLDQLKQAKEIAIDLEHHDAHSYIGIVSLMQISTREHDWIIDTLKPWRCKLEILNEVFTNPAIVKVFHGAHSDIIWLQRDFGLYVVGLFDTYDASRALGYTGHSLAFLLKRFIDFDAQKQYQMADWRIRPLPKELLDYARSDTHFLLYIFDRMRNELVDRSDTRSADENKVLHVLEESKDTSLQRFERPFYDEQGRGPNGYLKLLQRHGSHNLRGLQQLKVFQAVHRWRDQLARDEDENPLQIMANHALLNVARDIPTGVPQLLALCHPLSDFLRRNAAQLLQFIDKAKTDELQPTGVMDILLSPPNAQAPSYPGLDLSVRSLASEFWGRTNVFQQGQPQFEDRNIKIASRPVHVFLRIPYYSVTSVNVGTDMHLSQGNKRKATTFETPFTIDNSNGTQAVTSMTSEESSYPQVTRDKRAFDKISLHDESTTYANDSATMRQHLNRKLNHKMAKKQKQYCDPTQLGADHAENSTSTRIDYTKAKPVLSASMKQTENLRDPATSSFDPYAMASDAASGLRRTKVDGKERSKVFKTTN